MSKEAATRDASSFDIEAWAAGKITATDTQMVSSKPGLVRQLAALVDEHKALEQKSTARSKRLAEKDSGKADELAERIRTLNAELDGSWIEVEYRTPTPTERREANEEGGKTEEAIVAAMMARVGRIRAKGDEEWVTAPTAGWRQIFDTIGNDQYQRISEGLALLAYGKGVTPGFSQRVLSYLATQESSKS